MKAKNEKQRTRALRVRVGGRSGRPVHFWEKVSCSWDLTPNVGRTLFLEKRLRPNSGLNTSKCRRELNERDRLEKLSLCEFPTFLSPMRYDALHPVYVCSSPYRNFVRGSRKQSTWFLYWGDSIDFTDKKIASIQKKINSRPRQKLRFETPKAEFFKRIA